MYKKVLISLLIVCFVFSFFTINGFAATTYFTDAELQTIYSSGYPSNYVSNVDKFYDAFVGYAVPLLTASAYYTETHYSGNHPHFDGFLAFIGAIKSISKSDGQSSLPKVQLTRAFYFEVSNPNAKQNKNEEINGITDCLANRVIAGVNSTYMGASTSLDGLNPMYDGTSHNGANPELKNTFWHNIMCNPIPDAAGGGTVSINALATAYGAGYFRQTDIDHLGQDATACNKYFRFSSAYNKQYGPLPLGYCYFNETPGTGRIQIGRFYFRKTF